MTYMKNKQLLWAYEITSKQFKYSTWSEMIAYELREKLKKYGTLSVVIHTFLPLRYHSLSCALRYVVCNFRSVKSVSLQLLFYLYYDK